MKVHSKKVKVRKDTMVSKIGNNNSKNTIAAGTVAGNNPTEKRIVKSVDLTSFEKVIFFLLFLFILAVPVALVIRMDIMVFVGIIDFLILGAVAAIKPGMIISVMKKYDPKFLQKYEEKMNGLSIGLRLLGIFFFGVGAAIFKIVVWND